MNICSEIIECIIFFKVEFVLLEKVWGMILWLKLYYYVKCFDKV